MTIAPTTTIRIPQGLHQVLQEQARRRETSMASVIEQALARMLDDEFWRQANEPLQSPAVAAQIQADLAEWDTTAEDGDEKEDWSWLT